MIELQRLLLGDRPRNDAFAKALGQVIVPRESIVADIGSGTGFLGLLAEKLGAKECHLYEVSKDLIELSKKLAKENGIKRCKFFAGHSTEVKNPPKADIVVSETLGNWALEENIIETINDARRFLKPGGMIIPRKLRQYAAPVISPRLYDELNVWDSVGHDLSFDAAKEIAMNNMYVKDVTPDDLLPSPPEGRDGAGGGGLWDQIDFTKKNSSIRTNAIEWSPLKDVTLYGFACFWECDLLKGITIGTSPFTKPTHWKQIYLPLVDPLPAKKGQTIRLTLRSDSRYEVKIHVAWQTAIVDSKGKLVRGTKQDIRKGYVN